MATLCYWKIRGLAQPIRFLLEYTDTPYTDTFPDREQWPTEKFALGLDFPNLPYYVDGSVKLTQTNAILRYVARKTGMDGKSETEKHRMEMLECQTGDVRMLWGRTMYMSRDFEKDKKSYVEVTMPTFLKQYSDFLGENKWFAGENISYVDFIMYELLDIHRIVQDTCLDKFANLGQFITRVESLDAIKKYMASERFIKYPLNGPSAKFGG